MQEIERWLGGESSQDEDGLLRRRIPPLPSSSCRSFFFLFPLSSSLYSFEAFVQSIVLEQSAPPERREVLDNQSRC